MKCLKIVSSTLSMLLCYSAGTEPEEREYRRPSKHESSPSPPPPPSPQRHQHPETEQTAAQSHQLYARATKWTGETVRRNALPGCFHERGT